MKKSVYAALAVLVSVGFIELCSLLILWSLGVNPLERNLQSAASRIPSGYYVSANRPHFEYECTESWPDFKKGTIAVNDRGWLAADGTSGARDVNTLRVVLMGGSTAFGNIQNHSYVSDRSYPGNIYCWRLSIAGQLEDLLRKKFPAKKVEVINASIVAHFMHQHLFQYITSIRQIRPDVVVSLDGFNDMTGFVTGAPFHLAEDELKDYIDIEARLQQPLWPFTLSLIRYLHLRWHTTAHPHRTYAAGIDTTRWAQYKTISPLLDKGSRTFMEVAAHFVRTVRADSAQCIVVLQPMLGRKLNKPLTLKEQLLLADVHAQQSNPEIIEKFRKTHHLEDYGKLLGDDINQLSNTIHYYHYDSFISPGLQEAVEQCNGKFIDMNRVLAARQTNEDIYVDYCHLTPAGNRMVAEQIAELIE